MSKVQISPLLNSLFPRTDGMTKDEANTLVDVLTAVGSEDTKIVLAQSTSRSTGKANYLSIHDSDSKGLTNDVESVLSENGWMVTESRKGDQGSWWVYFIRN